MVKRIRTKINTDTYLNTDANSNRNIENNVNTINCTFTNIDAIIHIMLTLKENNNTTTYTDMDAASSTEIMFNMCVYIVRALFFGLI